MAKINSPTYYGSVPDDRHYLREDCDLPISIRCMRDSRGDAQFAIIGDSKALALSPGVFIESTAGKRWMFLGSSRSGDTSLVPVITDSPIYARNQMPIKAALQAVAGNSEIKVVVITSAVRSLFHTGYIESVEALDGVKNFDVALRGFDTVIGELIRSGKKVVVTTDNPTLKDPRFCIPRTTRLRFLDEWMGLKSTFTPSSIRYEEHMALMTPYRELLDKLQAKYPNDLRIFDTLPELCDMKNGLCSSAMDGHLLYSYTDHISDYAAVRVAKKLVLFAENFAQGD